MAPHSDAPAAGCSITLGDLAHLLDGSLDGDPDTPVLGIARLGEATPNDVSFCALPAYRNDVVETGAAAVIVALDFKPPAGVRGDLALIRVDNPYLATVKVVRQFFPASASPPTIHASAVIADSAEIGDGVSVGALAVIGEDCVIGTDTKVGAGCVLSSGARLGAACQLFPNVTLYSSVTIGNRVVIHAGAVLGADGFGYAEDGGKHVKIPQVGELVIEDDVEIGANTCIDRAALGATRIGRGAKIDNLVQIGHNCEVGADSVLCGQVGVAGSTKIGKGVLIGGQAGLSGHFSVGDGAMIAGSSGVINEVPAGTSVGGYPHLEASRWRRVVVALRTLPELARRVRRLEANVDGHEAKETDIE